MAEMSYFLTLTCVKLSILAFYWQTFAIRRSIKWPIYIITGIVCVWAVAVVRINYLSALRRVLFTHNAPLTIFLHLVYSYSSPMFSSAIGLGAI